MNKPLLPLLVMVFLLGLARAEEPVYFADPNLKAAVEEELWVSDPTPTDMLGLTSLRAGSLAITELTGLEYATNLQTLWLRFNRLTDISLLSALTNLEHLVLHRNWVSDLSPLSGLTNLYHLNLDDNQISDISPLSSLTNLRELILYDNQVTGLSTLLGLTSLELLDVRANPLSDAAYDVDIPQIIANNPGIDVQHNRGPYRLILSSGTGGSVVQPGEGEFILDDGKPVLLEAEADPCFVFVGFSGTWSTQENPVIVVLEYDHQIQATFESVLSVLHVDDDAPNDPRAADASASDPYENGTPEHPFDKIQEAIEVAAHGTVVLVYPGTYRENIDFLGKRIQLVGTDPNDSNATAWPVIEAATSGPVVHFTGGEDPNGTLAGFVVTGGKGTTAGVIRCSRATATIANCLIVGNRPRGLNAAVIHCEHGNAVFVNCTVTDNHIGACTAGFGVVDGEVTVTNSIFWNNTYSCWSNTNKKIFTDDGAEIWISYSNIADGWPGLGNIDADPLFARVGRWADPDNPHIVLGPDDPDAVWMMGDYHPKSQAGRWDLDLRDWVRDEVTSPCIDAGFPTTPVGHERAPNGGLINMGAHGGTTQAGKSPVSP